MLAHSPMGKPVEQLRRAPGILNPLCTSVALVKQQSTRFRCDNSTFGFASELRFWVGGGCRGVFECCSSGHRVRCGEPGDGKAKRTVCHCQLDLPPSSRAPNVSATACDVSSPCGERLRALLPSLHERVGFSSLLRDELLGSYSQRVYGAAGRVNLSTLRVIWPALIGPVARATLNGSVLCNIPSDKAWRKEYWIWLRARTRLVHSVYPLVPQRNFFVNVEAILVHQPGTSAHEPLPLTSHSWVEVSHCFFGSWAEGIHHGTPFWSWLAPGSGLSVNLGRAFHAVGKHENVERLHKVLVRMSLDSTQGREKLAKHLRALQNASEGEYDSVIFEARRMSSWYGERFTEIVLLDRPGKSEKREMSFVAKHLELFRCGGPREEDLRPCHPSDAAVRMHGPSCAMPRSPEQLAITGCPFAEVPGKNLAAVAEARSLRQEYRKRRWDTRLLERLPPVVD